MSVLRTSRKNLGRSGKKAVATDFGDREVCVAYLSLTLSIGDLLWVSADFRGPLSLGEMMRAALSEHVKIEKTSASGATYPMPTNGFVSGDPDERLPTVAFKIRH